MDGQVSGLGTVHPPSHFKLLWHMDSSSSYCFFPILFCLQSPSAMELWKTGQAPDRAGGL